MEHSQVPDCRPATNQAGSFTTKDGTRLSFRRWQPNKPTLMVVLSHGLISHTGTFDWLAGRLAELGAVIYGLDRHGCGDSPGPRGHIGDWRTLVADIAAFVSHCRSEFPGLPVWGVGHSMGGLLNAAVQIRQPHTFAGQIALTPGIASHARFPLHTRLQILVSAAGLNPQRYFPVPIADQLLSCNQEYLDELNQDTRRLREATAAFFWNFVRLQRYVRRRPAAMTCPVFIALACHDRIINNCGVQAWFRRLPPQLHSRLKIYAQCSHSLLHEAAREEVLQDMGQFFRQHGEAS